MSFGAFGTLFPKLGNFVSRFWFDNKICGKPATLQQDGMKRSFFNRHALG
jgi:hypothetical protein